MGDCTDPKSSTLSGAFPNRNQSNTSNTGLQITIPQNSAILDTLLSAAQTYNALNSAVNEMLGYEVRWFRAVPQQRSKDVIFQEYTLSNVEADPLCLKVVLPDGNFPDSRYDFNLMGLEYEIPLEIHIDKRYWERIAGYGTAPQKKDIVYFAMPNKLYQVESAYLFRGFMEQETAWKLNLRKYMPESSRRESAALRETIDNYTVSEAEIFGDAIQADINKITADKQFSPINSTERDKYKTIDASVSTISSAVNMHGIIVAQSFYDLSYSKTQDAVTYGYGDTINEIDNRCITAWTMIKPTAKEIEVTDINYISTTDVSNYKVTTRTILKDASIGKNIEISRPGALNFYAEIVDIDIVRNILYVHVDTQVEDYLNSIKTDWTSAKGYKLKIQEPVSILDGRNSESHGFKVDIFANQFIKIHYGTQEHIAITSDKLLDNEWYGIIINIGNSWKQYNVYVYQRHPSDTVGKLQNVFYETMNFVPELTVVDTYTINRSPSYLTNIRLYTVTIEEEKQANELLAYFSKDSDQALILDNCDLKFRAPYISKQR